MFRFTLVRLVCPAVVAVPFLLVATAHAADPAVVCETGKLKVAGRYASCRLKAESRGVKRGQAADYTKCISRFVDKWGKAEAKAGPAVCPTEGDEGAMDLRITVDAVEIATLLAGGSLSASCGDSVIGAGEVCDFGDLGGETCATQGFFGDGLVCSSCVAFDTSGCSATRYEDTGLGSVIDHQTGLEWQKTDDMGGLTDKDNVYSWTADGFGGLAPNGTAFTVFLTGLNAPDGPGTNVAWGPTATGCYAGHCDWRMPVVEELTTIVELSFGNPRIDQSAFGPTNTSSAYWSSSTLTNIPGDALNVFFDVGNVINTSKGALKSVRAVRGGS